MENLTPQEKVIESLNGWGSKKGSLLTIVESSAQLIEPATSLTDEELKDFSESFQKWGKAREPFNP